MSNPHEPLKVEKRADSFNLLMPDRMIMHLFSPNALAINDDYDWLRARQLLGSLFRKHGPFVIEVLDKGKVVVNGGLQA